MARCYEFGKKNINYFYNLEKRNYWKKHITSLTSENGLILSDPESILEEKPNFYEKIYQSKQHTFCTVFESEGLTFLDNVEANQCEGLLTLEECAKVIGSFQNDKTPGPEGLTVEFYRRFWHLLGKFMVVIILPFKQGVCQSPKDLELFHLFPKRTRT